MAASGDQFLNSEPIPLPFELQHDPSETTPSYFDVIKSQENSFSYDLNIEHLLQNSTNTSTAARTTTQGLGTSEIISPSYQYSSASPSSRSPSHGSTSTPRQSPFEQFSPSSSLTPSATNDNHHSIVPHGTRGYLSPSSTTPTIPPTPQKPASTYEYLGVLHIAAQKGHDRIIQMLLSHHGMDCNAPDSEGRTPLMHAVVAGHAPVVRALLTAGARCDAVDNKQRSVLHLAVLHRREPVLRLLLAEIEQGVVDGVHPIGPGEARLACLLDAYDADGNTPLHLAVTEGFEAGVVMLVRSGSDLEVEARRC
ncbi:Histone-lysine N-methyltransferase EHMT1 [Colletotrichum siamense]|uniref:Histone-lysine N-methyltransferase EHMT1 n=1 Tax=Colletotrichum siamense TaxID=690259 RepID=A0A9P5EMR3_COLSI|nr:Histone-lysine N-methyltransferase EHMT1 [Colletotrichum siamense]KAF4840104.1 Histone-lysine N-methyltransferase EHMT1 [Colletotrichum siamense]KAF4854579.1 Histone-lysine N-methyltransferase EHMT1 [Colletotrichum siamense]KAF5484327.1 Histone-lysine N-methyltransferase EHMT1 [Colletotrichum siamense]